MRPDSLTLQYKVPDEKKRHYYRLGFMRKMRSPIRSGKTGKNLSLQGVQEFDRKINSIGYSGLTGQNETLNRMKMDVFILFLF